MSLTGKECQEWESLFDRMMNQYCPGRESLFDLVLDLTGFLHRGGRLHVLDAGCGSGAFLQRLMKRYPHARAWGVDSSQRTLDVARCLLPSDQAAWLQADLEDPTWSDSVPQGFVDVAFCGWTAHEIPAWRLGTLYEGIARCLRPGGLLFVADFVSGLQPGFQQAAADLARSRVTSDWREFTTRLDSRDLSEESPPPEPPPSTRWVVHHSRQTHLAALGEAGFQEPDELWRYLNSSLFAAVR